MLQMFFLSASEHDHIVQVDNAVCQVQFSERVLHQVLEGCWGITESKRHTGELIKPQIAHREGSVLLGFWCHLHLPKPALEIHSQEVGRSSHALQCFLYPQQLVRILLCSCIKLMKVHAKVQHSVLFLH